MVNEVGRKYGTHGREEESIQDRVLVEKPEAKRPLERPKRRWENGIKMDLKEIGCGGRVDPVGSG
jgi:hypothetical protein